MARSTSRPSLEIPRNAGLGKLVTSGLLVTTGAFVKKKPQIAEAIVAAINEAGAFIKANPRRAAEISLETERLRGTYDNPWSDVELTLVEFFNVTR